MILLHSVSDKQRDIQTERHTDRETYRQTDSYLVQRERLGGGVLHVPLSVADCGRVGSRSLSDINLSNITEVVSLINVSVLDEAVSVTAPS